MIQVVSATHEEIDELIELQQRNPPFNFSCNRWGKVWPTPVFGYTHPEDRNYVDFALLNEIARIVLKADCRARRFYLTAEGAFISGSDEQIAAFRFAPSPASTGGSPQTPG